MIPPAMQSAGTMMHVNAGARMVTVAAIAPAARIARVTASSWVNVFMIDAIACLWREAKESNLLNPRCPLGPSDTSQRQRGFLTNLAYMN